MNIQKKRISSRKKIFTAIAIALALTALGLGAAYTMGYGPFSKNQPLSTSSKNEQKTEKTNDESKESNTTQTPSTSDTSSTDTSSQSDNTYVDTPISNPPTDTSPYPIENEHYKIQQNNPTNYSVTLYPIANNPDYSDYNSQLKAYKQEVLTYLKHRYGSISNFTFTWSPESAKNL